MREMKDSGIEWIGEIPADWEVSTIKREYVFQTGWTPDTTHEEYFVGENIWINISDMKSKVVYDSEKHISDEAVRLASMNISPKGSLLYAFKLSVGAVSFCGIDMYTNEAIATFLPGKNNLRFLYYTAPIFIIKNANENIYGAKLLNQKLIRNAKIVIPPLEVQKRIADCLDRKCSQIDAIIVRQQEVIEKLKAYKLSVITEAVTKGLNPDVPMKDSGVEWIGEIPEHWEVMRFGRCAAIKSNLVAPDDYADYPQISPDSIEKNSGRILEYKTVKESGVISWNHLFFKGQIIYSKIRPMLNKVAIAPFDGLCSADMYPIETNNNTQFLVYMMLSDYFTSQVGLVTENRVKMPKINQNELGAIMVTIPPQIEQETISKYLLEKCSSVDAVIDKKQGLIDKLDDDKKSLIYEVVTGKKEV